MSDGSFLHEVRSVRSTAEDGVFICEIDMTDILGERRQVEFVSRTNDAHGLGPVVRQWLDANPDFPKLPYVAPTAEEVRASLPHLSARQLRLGLVSNGIQPTQVQATLEAMPAGVDKDKALIEWEYATTFNRMHPLIASVGAALGLTDEQIDSMWAAALSL